MDLTVSYQTLNFGITLPSIFGNNVNHLLNIFGSTQSGVTLSDDNGVFHLGDQYALDGRTVEMLGSGFAQPGISLLGLIVPTGFPVDVMIMQDVDTGQYLFVYPNGTPNILGAIALVTNTSAMPYSATFAGAPPICFCSGTLIATPGGPRPVEQIRGGDEILGADGRPRRVLWAGGKTHASLPPEHRPIIIRRGALGPNLPARTLRLSPQHRVILGDARPWPRFAPAKAFTILPGVRQEQADKPVGYHHIMLERHGAIVAEGLAVECLLIGDCARETLGPAALEQIAALLGCESGEIENQPEAQPGGVLLGPRSARRKIGELVAFGHRDVRFGSGPSKAFAAQTPLIGA